LTSPIVPASNCPRQATAFLDVIRRDLDAIERNLHTTSSSEVHQVDAVGQHVLLAGGKRLRPACVVLAARSVSSAPPPERLVTVATALELVHTATLVHDDVVDNTRIRRGAATANAVFGNGVAVLTGDFLLARAVSILAREDDTRLIRTVADITGAMSEGEVQQMVATGDPEVAEDAYYAMIRKKTATFIEGCCRCGAIVGNASSADEEALVAYGQHLGLAFQITDDLLDYIGDPAETGKPVGGDLREGRATLPLLYALRAAVNGKRNAILEAFGNPAVQDPAIAFVVRSLRTLGAIDRTTEVAASHVRRAKEALQSLRPSPYRDSLEQLADYVIGRDR